MTLRRMDFAYLCFPLESAAEACSKYMSCGLEESNGEARKHGNTQHIVVPNVAIWNAGVQ
jgi:hypothetical protein